VIEQLSPNVIVTKIPQVLLADSRVVASSMHCVLVEDDGLLQVAALCATHAEDRDDDSDPPVILGHDLNGRQAQALAHALERAGRKVRVVHRRSLFSAPRMETTLRPL
ncbi:MAG: hypothetical protein ACKPKO_65345, partial [Candidatus Fonsibacter sp.]